MVWQQYQGARWLPRYQLAGHTGPVRAVSVSPGGSLAYSGACDATIRGWDLSTGTQVCGGSEGVRLPPPPVTEVFLFLLIPGFHRGGRGGSPRLLHVPPGVLLVASQEPDPKVWQGGSLAHGCIRGWDLGMGTQVKGGHDAVCGVMGCDPTPPVLLHTHQAPPHTHTFHLLQAGPAYALGGSSRCCTLVAQSADGRGLAAAGDGDSLIRFWAPWKTQQGGRR